MAMMTMKWGPAAMALAVALQAGTAFAQPAADCMGNTYTQLNQSQVQTLLSGTTACYPTAAPYQNQEYLSGNTLWDFKKGPTDPVDPSTNIGTVSINSDGTVTYVYGGGPTYQYSIWGTATSGPGTYDFCSSASAGIVVRVVPGQGCGA
jgi:hypothetical protein